MSGPPPRDCPPGRRKDVAKYLLDDEEAVLAVRRHWAVLIEPTVKFLPASVLGGWLLLLDPENRVTTTRPGCSCSSRRWSTTPCGWRVVDAALHRQPAAGAADLRASSCAR